MSDQTIGLLSLLVTLACYAANKRVYRRHPHPLLMPIVATPIVATPEPAPPSARLALRPDHPAPQAMQERQRRCPEQGADRKGDEERQARGQRRKMIGGEIEEGPFRYAAATLVAQMVAQRLAPGHCALESNVLQ